jgi:shikimate kinase
MEHYRENGKVIYLQMSFEEMERRVSSDYRRRGVVIRKGQTLRDMYEERCKLYTIYADFTIAEEQLNMEETLQKILDCIS